MKNWRCLLGAHLFEWDKTESSFERTATQKIYRTHEICWQKGTCTAKRLAHEERFNDAGEMVNAVGQPVLA